MAQVVEDLGKGGQLLSEQEFGWNRGTIQKGTHELKSGFAAIIFLPKDVNLLKKNYLT
jgi:hypothetical protein